MAINPTAGSPPPSPGHLSNVGSVPDAGSVRTRSRSATPPSPGSERGIASPDPRDRDHGTMRYPPPLDHRPPSTRHILNLLEQEGTDACVRKLADRLPPDMDRFDTIGQLLSGQAVESLNSNFWMDSEVLDDGMNRASRATNAINSGLELERLTQCCIAERYSRKYDTSIYLASTAQNKARFLETLEGHLRRDEPCGFAISDYVGNASFDKGGGHSSILAVVPNRDAGTCSMIFSDSIGHKAKDGLGPEYIDDLIDLCREQGLDAVWYRTADGRQTDMCSCHTDALHSLKELLKNDADVGGRVPSCNVQRDISTDGNVYRQLDRSAAYRMRNILTEHIFTPPPNLLKTAQLSDYLSHNDYDEDARYAEQKSIGEHRSRHVFASRRAHDPHDDPSRYSDRSMFLPAKTLQYADVALTHLLSRGSENFDAATREVRARRDLSTPAPSDRA